MCDPTAFSCAAIGNTTSLQLWLQILIEVNSEGYKQVVKKFVEKSSANSDFTVLLSK